jgi:hypothetical protein
MANLPKTKRKDEKELEYLKKSTFSERIHTNAIYDRSGLCFERGIIGKYWRKPTDSSDVNYSATTAGKSSISGSSQ